MLTYPNIDPVALSLGSIKIHWYGLMYLVGFVGAWLLGRFRAKKNGWTAEENLAGIGSCVTENYGYTNRVLQVAGNQSEPVVCWNSCSDCEGDDVLGCTDTAA